MIQAPPTLQSVLRQGKDANGEPIYLGSGFYMIADNGGGAYLYGAGTDTPISIGNYGQLTLNGNALALGNGSGGGGAQLRIDNGQIVFPDFNGDYSQPSYIQSGTSGDFGGGIDFICTLNYTTNYQGGTWSIDSPSNPSIINTWGDAGLSLAGSAAENIGTLVITADATMWIDASPTTTLIASNQQNNNLILIGGIPGSEVPMSRYQIVTSNMQVTDDDPSTTPTPSAFFSLNPTIDQPTFNITLALGQESNIYNVFDYYGDQVAYLSADGTFAASAFLGDGSGLTGITASVSLPIISNSAVIEAESPGVSLIENAYANSVFSVDSNDNPFLQGWSAGPSADEVAGASVGFDVSGNLTVDGGEGIIANFLIPVTFNQPAAFNQPITLGSALNFDPYISAEADGSGNLLLTNSYPTGTAAAFISIESANSYNSGPSQSIHTNMGIRVEGNSYPSAGQGTELVFDDINSLGIVEAYDRDTNLPLAMQVGVFGTFKVRDDIDGHVELGSYLNMLEHNFAMNDQSGIGGDQFYLDSAQFNFDSMSYAVADGTNAGNVTWVGALFDFTGVTTVTGLPFQGTATSDLDMSNFNVETVANLSLISGSTTTFGSTSTINLGDSTTFNFYDDADEISASLTCAGGAAAWSGTIDFTGATVLGLTDSEITYSVEDANTMLLGPASGSPDTPTWRTLTTADLPEFVTGSSPTILAGIGAGTGGTAALDANAKDLAGRITIVVGTLPTLGSAVATVTYSDAFPNDSYVNLTPANSAAQLLSGATMVGVLGSSTTFVITSGTTALPAGTYIWNYNVIGV